MKVLIISLRAGAGHVKAAEALKKAFDKIASKVETKVIDFLDYSTILSKKFYSDLYIDIVNKAPDLYAWLYKRITPTSTTFRLLFDRINAAKFKKYILEYQPDVVIATHFVPANLLTFWRKTYKLKYKVGIVVTDYEAHCLWADKQADFYAVATKEVKKSLIKFGIDAEIIKEIGIPIDLKFLKRYSKNKIYKKFGLKKKFTISIFSGGFGMGPIEKIFENLNNLSEDFQLIVLAGKNKELFSHLKKAAQRETKKILIFGFVDNIEEVMAISDIIITKAGGLTVTECLAMGVPLMISNPISGQEEANSRYLLSHRAALRADKSDEIKSLIKNIIKNKEILRKLRYNIKKIAKPRAALKIAELIKEKWL